MNNQFFTQAGNFASAVTAGVDPRTGLFFMKNAHCLVKCQ